MIYRVMVKRDIMVYLIHSAYFSQNRTRESMHCMLKYTRKSVAEW